MDTVIFKPKYKKPSWVTGAIIMLLFIGFFLFFIVRGFGYTSVPFLGISTIGLINISLMVLTQFRDMPVQIEFREYVIFRRALFPPLCFRYKELAYAEMEERENTSDDDGMLLTFGGYRLLLTSMKNYEQLESILLSYLDNGKIALRIKTDAQRRKEKWKKIFRRILRVVEFVIPILADVLFSGVYKKILLVCYLLLLLVIENIYLAVRVIGDFRRKLPEFICEAID